MRTMMPTLAALVLACVGGMVAGQDRLGAAASSYPRGEEAIALLREIWEYSAAHIYPAHLSERFEARTLERLEGQLRSAEQPGLVDVLNPFLETLGVSHTRFYDRRHQSYYLLRSLFSTQDLDTPPLYTIGVQLDDRDVGWVRAVMQGSPAAAAGIRYADRIRAVDAAPFESLLQWQHATPTRLELDRQGERIEVSLTPILQGFHRSLERATRASARVLTCGEQRIGYLHLWSGTHDVFLEILNQAIADAHEQQLDGFILDLRDGYGGAWWPYLDPFFVDRAEYFAYETRDASGTTDPVRASPASQANAWLGPLAVLTNDGTRSGKESLAFQFKKSGRATLFGTTTAGAFTAGRGVFAERAADYLLYLSVHEYLLDGTEIEGVGVTPDVLVEREPERDGPLEAALQELGCRAAHASAGPAPDTVDDSPLSGAGK